MLPASVRAEEEEHRMIWAWIAGAVAVLIFAVAQSKIKICLSFVHMEQNDEIRIDVRSLFGLIRFRYIVPLLRFRGWLEGLELKSEKTNPNKANIQGEPRRKIDFDKIKKAIDDLRILLHNCFKFNQWFRRLLSRFHCTELNWKTSAGIGDAAETGVVVGTLWGLKTSLLGYIFRTVRLDAKPELQVMPVFNQNVFITEGIIRLHIRLWHLVAAALQLLLRILKVKGGLRAWKKVLLRT